MPCFIRPLFVTSANMVNSNGTSAGTYVLSSAFFGNNLRKVSFNATSPNISSANLKIVAEVDEEKQTTKDKWRGLAFDVSDDQQDITRGKGMVDSLFKLLSILTHPNITIIGEEVAAQKQTLKSVTDYITDIICKRAELGFNYGVILIPEGLIDFILEVQQLIAELNEILAHDVVDKGVWKKKLRSQSH